ncbi:hypothetical protein H3O04_34825, partial [Burkholderia sp. KCJ3K979]|nr:hypothetical protein [Burkholderia sp. KCJ3K979]
MSGRSFIDGYWWFVFRFVFQKLRDANRFHEAHHAVFGIPLHRSVRTCFNALPYRAIRERFVPPSGDRVHASSLELFRGCPTELRLLMKTKKNVKLTGIALSVAAVFSLAATASQAVVVTAVPGSLSNTDGLIIEGASPAPGGLVGTVTGWGNGAVTVGNPNAGGISIGLAGTGTGSAAIGIGSGLLEPVAGVAGTVTGALGGLGG